MRRRARRSSRRGTRVAVICEGDPLFYGSYMQLHVRLSPRYPTEVIAGVTGMSGCWSRGRHADRPGRRRLHRAARHACREASWSAGSRDADAAVIMKLGRNLPKVRRALGEAGLLARAIYVERGTMAGAMVMPPCRQG